MSKEESKKPAFAKQLGHIRVATWANEVDGRTFFNTTITRRYRDKNENYQESSSFNGQADLILVQAAANLAAAWVDSQTPEAGGEEE